MKKLFYLGAFIVVALGSCVEAPQYPIEPSIDFISVSRDTISPSDSISFNISFTDGDGDLGSDEDVAVNPNDTLCRIFVDSLLCDQVSGKYMAYSLLALDNRTINNIRCIKTSRIPFIPAKGSSKAISGDITFVTPRISCIPGKVVDTLSYLIIIRDRAGHCSNVVKTPNVYVMCGP
jgi:hypothetical protein